jgi:hypothetical protein
VKRIEAVFLLLGALVLTALLRRYGLKETLDALRPLGPWLPLVFALEAVAKALNTWALRAVLPPGGKDRPGFGAMLDATLQADAVNSLLPTASLGGNAILIRRLCKSVGTADATAAVTSANSAQTIAQFLFVLAGTALAAGSFAPTRELRLGLMATVAVLATGLEDPPYPREQLSLTETAFPRKYSARSPGGRPEAAFAVDRRLCR